MNETTTFYLPTAQQIRQGAARIRAGWSQDERQERRKAAQERQLKIVRLVSPQKRFPQYAA